MSWGEHYQQNPATTIYLCKEFCHGRMWCRNRLHIALFGAGSDVGVTKIPPSIPPLEAGLVPGNRLLRGLSVPPSAVNVLSGGYLLGQQF